MKKTKIICTLGPASEELKTIEEMIKAGMNAVRLNFAHGTYENFTKIIKNVKNATKKLKTEVAIIQDLQGSKIRVGKLKTKGIKVKKGETLIVRTDNKEASKKPYISVDYKNLYKEVKKTNLILIDDGLIELKVKQVKGEEILCEVTEGGIIKPRKGVNVPFSNLSTSSITPKDKKDLHFGLKHNLDYIALSFVKSAEDIKQLRKTLEKAKSDAKIIAKIERHEAIENLEEIIKEADVIMVARGDLGVEIEPEKVPLAQKEIIRTCNIYGKPVIVATQMLASMVKNPRATRAEISDAATAVMEHADALMLSNETSIGEYPVHAVQTLTNVAKEIEKELKKRQHLLPNLLKGEDMPIVDATCFNACKMANDIKARYIVVLTKKGYTAKQVAKHRIYIPIITLTKNERVKQDLAIVWGINHIIDYNVNKIPNNIEKQVAALLQRKKLVKKGNEVVIVNVRKGKNLISTIKI